MEKRSSEESERIGETQKTSPTLTITPPALLDVSPKKDPSVSSTIATLGRSLAFKEHRLTLQRTKPIRETEN